MLPENKIRTDSTNDVEDDEVVETIQVEDDEIVEVEDSTGDVNVAAKLPPHGIYAVKLRNPKKDDQIYKSKSKDGRAFAAVNGLAVEIQEEEYEGFAAFVNHVNSLTRRGKTTSELHHLLNVAGEPAPNRTTVGQLETHVREVLEKEPVCYAEIDWKAQYKNGKGEYIELKTTMEGFPKHYVNSDGETVSSAKEGKWDGTYVQQLPHPETGEPVEAQLWVRKFLTQAEANKLRSKTRSI